MIHRHTHRAGRTCGYLPGVLQRLHIGEVKGCDDHWIQGKTTANQQQMWWGQLPWASSQIARNYRGGALWKLVRSHPVLAPLNLHSHQHPQLPHPPKSVPSSTGWRGGRHNEVLKHTGLGESLTVESCLPCLYSGENGTPSSREGRCFEKLLVHPGPEPR